MSDELRDRIAEIIERSLTVWMNDLSAGGAEADYAAQAVIDEFGLTVEERFVYATDLARDDEPVTDDMAQRVVGKWEKQ